MEMEDFKRKIKTNQWTELLDDVKDLSPSDALESLGGMSAAIFHLTDVTGDAIPVVAALCGIVLKDNAMNSYNYLQYLCRIITSLIKLLKNESTAEKRRTISMKLLCIYKKITPLIIESSYSPESRILFHLLQKNAKSVSELILEDDPNVYLEVMKYASLLCLPNDNNLALFQENCEKAVDSYNLQAKSLNQPEERTKENVISFHSYILRNVLKALVNNYQIESLSEAMFVLGILLSFTTHHGFENCCYFFNLLKQCCNIELYSSIYTGIRLFHTLSNLKHKDKNFGDFSRAVNSFIQCRNTFENNITCQVINGYILVKCFRILDGEFEESKKTKVVSELLKDQFFDYLLKNGRFLLAKSSYILCLNRFLRCLLFEIKRVGVIRGKKNENDAIFRKTKEFCCMVHERFKNNKSIIKGNASHYKDFADLCGIVGTQCLYNKKFSLSLECSLASIDLLEACIDVDPENTESLLSLINCNYKVAYESCRRDGKLINEYSNVICNEIKLYRNLGTLNEKVGKSETMDEVMERWVRAKVPYEQFHNSILLQLRDLMVTLNLGRLR